MSDLSPLQQEYMADKELPEGVETRMDFVEWCEHEPEPKSTGTTGREYCPMCGKVFGPTLMEYKYD